MGFIAIVGGGPLGSAIAQALALRDRVNDVRLVDVEGSIARGKALDLLQSAAVEGFATRVSAADSFEAAVGADVVVIADAASGEEYEGESGLALLRRLERGGHSRPIVCAGCRQRDMMAKGVFELGIPRTWLIGSAPFALESALRALTGVALDRSGVEVSLRVLGVPPRAAVVGWEGASASGQPLVSQLPPHIIAGLTARIPGLWPPGPYALGSAAAQVVEAISTGTRRRFSCFVTLEAGPERRLVAAFPVELGREGVHRIIEPDLTRQERTLLDNALENA